MILTGSRYMGQPVLSIEEADGSTGAAVFGGPPTLVSSFSYYTVQTGDRFDLIAARVYGVPDYWWKIADANPEIFYPEVIPVGAVIRIPSS